MTHPASTPTAVLRSVMRCAALTLVLFTFGAVTVRGSDDLPEFAGRTPGVSREITIPTIDISAETDRHVFVARGTEDTYQGHADTLLMPDGKTMFAAWSIGHAVHIGPLKRSDDSGLTWSDLIDVPENWWKVSNTPTIHRLVDPEGTGRLFVFGGGLRFPGVKMQQAVSEDGGRTWSRMEANGLIGEVPPKDILTFEDGRKVVMWSDRRDPWPHVWQSASYDGGLTWSEEEKIFRTPGYWTQPTLVRSPDGTLVATTYVKYQPGLERHSVVSVRFTLEELDRKVAEQESAQSTGGLR